MTCYLFLDLFIMFRAQIYILKNVVGNRQLNQ